MGLTLVARVAGHQQANRAMGTKRNATAINVAGSVGATPKRNAVRRREKIRAGATPIRRRAVMSRSPCPNIRLRIAHYSQQWEEEPTAVTIQLCGQGLCSSGEPLQLAIRFHLPGRNRRHFRLSLSEGRSLAQSANDVPLGIFIALWQNGNPVVHPRVDVIIREVSVGECRQETDLAES